MGFTDALKSSLAYSTPRIVRFENWKLGLLHLLIQVLIFSYIVVYSIVLQKGYQAISPVIGSCDIKVKGSAYTIDPTTDYATIYDAIDLIKPAEQPDAVFITTNLWNTLNQTQTTCAATASPCTTNADCVRDDGTAEGVITGTCDTSVGQCMLQTWCPLENEPSNTSTGLKGTEDFTIFIRNNVNFADFGIHRSNIEENSLQMGYNLFSVRQIINMAGFTYDEIQDHGASIAMTADWKCDFDQADSKCRPTFSAERLDNAKSHFSSGFNFRDATYYIDGSRDIHKRYGLKLTFRTSGDGRKFSIVPLLTALGAGVGLLAIATVVCDFIATKIGNDKDFYLHEKFRVITSEEVEAHMFNSDSNESASNHSSRRTSTTGDSEETLGGHPYIHIDTEAEHIQQPSSSPSAAGDYNPPTVV